MNSSINTYGMIQSVYSYGAISRTSYGISAYVTDGDEEIRLILSIHDISSDGIGLMSLLDQCNRLNLSRRHISDVVEDFIG